MSGGGWLAQSRLGSRDFYGAARFCLTEARESACAEERAEWVAKAAMWRDMARKSRRVGR